MIAKALCSERVDGSRNFDRASVRVVAQNCSLTIGWVTKLYGEPDERTHPDVNRPISENREHMSRQFALSKDYAGIELLGVLPSARFARRPSFVITFSSER